MRGVEVGRNPPVRQYRRDQECMARHQSFATVNQNSRGSRLAPVTTANKLFQKADVEGEEEHGVLTLQ